MAARVLRMRLQPQDSRIGRIKEEPVNYESSSSDGSRSSTPADAEEQNTNDRLDAIEIFLRHNADEDFSDKEEASDTERQIPEEDF